MVHLTSGERVEDLVKTNRGTITGDAAKIGTSQCTLSDFINGKRDIKSDTLKKICEYYNVSADYVLGLSDIPKRNETLQNVNRVTGLQEQAIINLQTLKADKSGYIDILNEMLSSEYLVPFLNAVSFFLHGDRTKEKIMKTLQGEMVKTSTHIDRYAEIENEVWSNVNQKAVIEALMWKMIEEQGEGEK